MKCLEKVFTARRTGIFGYQITHVGLFYVLIMNRWLS